MADGNQEGPGPQPRPQSQPPAAGEPLKQPPKPQQQRARTVRGRPQRHRGAVDRIRDVHFPLVLRGYDRSAVDAHLAEITQLVAELEATQLRENVVQRALDEVGEQTSSILQRAHETAEEVAARSRAQAEGRIQRAEREAEMIRREAEKYAEQVAADTRRLTEERRRLIDELRQYAEDVLATADDALERLPELLAERPGDAPAEAEPPADQPTQSLPQPAEPAPETEPKPEPAPREQEAPPAPPAEPEEFTEGIVRVERKGGGPKTNRS
jgi:cell division initiation protein